MKSGLIIGKFMPLHNGHLALINFASEHCDLLYIALCYTENEIIPGSIRQSWLRKVAAFNSKIEILAINYNETDLPNTSDSSNDVAEKWSLFLMAILPSKPDIIFSSEDYGNFVANAMGAVHIKFDQERKNIPISATAIRSHPFNFWNYIPEIVRPYYVKKVAIVGSESTGKSTLTKMLAEHFESCYVKEMAREIIEHTEECTPAHLQQIAALHATEITVQQALANKLLFSDTELNVTKSYCQFLFQRELVVDDWIETANTFDLYLFLDTDCPFEQDGTRLDISSRNELSLSHIQQLSSAKINFVRINGNWSRRFNIAVSIIEEKYFK